MLNADIRTHLGVRRVVNASGTMSWLGASIVVPEAIEAIEAALPQFIEMDDLQRVACAVIGDACGAEAGFVTASCSAAITLSVAAAMTGDELAAIERLPDTTGMRNEVLIQTGHLIHYGAPIDQAIRLTGAKVVPIGPSTNAQVGHVVNAITPRTCAAVYVVSHHAAQCGVVPLEAFIACCHARRVPVIVDAASEYDLRIFIAAGADLALYSAHKFLGGPTAGVVAGRLDLVRAGYFQNRGIGRGMKVGKEGIVGTIAALQAWGRRDHAAVRARETVYLRLWAATLASYAGVSCSIEPDPTSNPLDRLKVCVDPRVARVTAWNLAFALAEGNPPVIVRDHEVEHGYFFLDPCNLHPGEEQIVAARLVEELDNAGRLQEAVPTTFEERRTRKLESALSWPARANALRTIKFGDAP